MLTIPKLLRKTRDYLRSREILDPPYTPFVIVGNPRTGSNFLRDLLNQHEHIKAFGELFRFNHTIGWDLPGYDRHAKAELELMNKNPIGFLKEKIFMQYPSSIKAVGFKIFYFHAQENEWQGIWSYLQKQKNIKIIHIKRKNVLKTYLSHTRALLTNVWVNTRNREEDQTPLSLDYEKCRLYFQKVTDNEKKYDDFFKHHHRLELFYEDLTALYRQEAGRVFDFLEVPDADVAPAMFKQARIPLHQSIANYSQLKNQFRASPWEKFFED